MLNSPKKPDEDVSIDDQPKAKPAHQRTSFDWLLSFGSIVLVFTTLLILLGYGVALAAEVHLGVPHSTLFISPLDLLDLSSIALNGFFAIGAQALTSVKFYRMIIEQASWPIWLSVACLGLLFVYRWLEQPITYVVRWLQTKLSLFVPQTIRVREDRTLLAVIKLSALAIAVPVVMVVSLAGVLGIFAVIAMFPVYGMAAGEYHLKTWVVGPERCMPVVGRQERLRVLTAAASAAEAREAPRAKSEKVVHCVSMTRDDKTYAGRVAFSTSSALVLFTPSSGAVRRVPLDGATVEVVATDEVRPEEAAREQQPPEESKGGSSHTANAMKGATY
jgi:hypothetical protein